MRQHICPKRYITKLMRFTSTRSLGAMVSLPIRACTKWPARPVRIPPNWRSQHYGSRNQTVIILNKHNEYDKGCRELKGILPKQATEPFLPPESSLRRMIIEVVVGTGQTHCLNSHSNVHAINFEETYLIASICAFFLPSP